MRYFLECAYLGERYSGWQRQPNADSVQAVLEEALSTLLGAETALTGAGRTDAGVHARLMPAHFDSETQLEAGELSHRLNRFLPEDITILRIVPVRDDAHARFDAVSRSYEYWLINRRDPFLQGRAHYIYGDLNFERMNQAALGMLGKRDFECFSKSNTDVKTFHCDLKEAEWRRESEHLWVFHITADRFLRNMVRAVVGTLLEIGQGKREVSWIQEVLDSRNRSAAGASVAAKGLYLTRVNYPDDIWL
jgi:tRNA pseudouridine38-40 synthase